MKNPISLCGYVLICLLLFGISISFADADDKILGTWRHDKYSDLALAVQDPKDNEFLWFESDGTVSVLLGNLINLTRRKYNIVVPGISVRIGNTEFQYTIKDDELTLIHQGKKGVYYRFKEATK